MAHGNNKDSGLIFFVMQCSKTIRSRNPKKSAVSSSELTNDMNLNDDGSESIYLKPQAKILNKSQKDL
jgi:hypothetical protein